MMLFYQLIISCLLFILLPALAQACTTTTGTACQLPFIYEGRKRWQCILDNDPDGLAWCSTAVDDAGVHKTGSWGHCDPDCPTGPPACKLDNGNLGECVAATACIGADLAQLDAAARNSGCPEEVGSTQTVCCPIQVGVPVALPPAEQLPTADNLSEETEAGLNEIFEKTIKEIEDEEVEANQLDVGFRAGLQAADRSPTFFHQKFNKPRRDILELDASASLLQKVATKVAEDRKDLTEEGGIGLRAAFNSATSRTIRSKCPWNTTRIACDPASSYRTMDGTCNNLKEANYGRTGTPFQRILLPEYAGIAIHLPRRRPSDGFELPSARSVSLQMAVGADPPDRENSLLLMQMGQFVDHDLTHTPAYENLDCCNKGGKYPRAFNAEKCFPIRLEQKDPFWQGVTGCMDFFRSLSSPGLNCELQHREQLNQVTHWLDGSNIYGSTNEDAATLRGTAGRLKTSAAGGGGSGPAADLLPSCRAASPSKLEACEACETEADECFFAGDVRVNEQPNLVVIHTIFVREHNRLVGVLAGLNPSWRSERLFQEARRITVAEYQHIVYKEWLPAVIGNNFMRLFGLLPLSAGHSTDYQDNFDPRINNEFAAAAFRFGHSMVAATFHMPDRQGGAGKPLNLSDVFFKPKVVRSAPDSVERLVRGLVTEEPRAWDASFVADLRNHLFETRQGRGGLDLVAINIQRGRDHGLPGYIRYVDICSGKKISSWSDLDPILGPDSVKRLQAVYRNPEDVDLFVGGFLEAAHEDALVGPVFKCIIGDQFARLKKGDRFFYDLGVDPRTAFTVPQLAAVRAATMARLLCENTSIEAIQPFAFKMPFSDVNAVRSCAEILTPAVDWSPFKDK